ncbi:MAG: helix-turn-helix transcriptional regulator [Spirochaetia bacterium]|nr:helix-turn-helix transcriptional regulator [Spirochaetia bacterium]
MSAKISVRLLASLEGLTPNYFGNRFLRIFGVSPQGYLLERRINQARHLLWEGKKVNEVARLTGPWDAFYFSRMFKSRTGFSPKEYSRLLSR